VTPRGASLASPVTSPSSSELPFRQQQEQQQNSKGMEELFARQLQVEKQERNSAISWLRARFEELNEKVQDLQQHSNLQQQQTLLQPKLQQPQLQQHIPSLASPRRLAITQEFSSVSTVAEQMEVEVCKFENRLQALVNEIGQSNERLRNGPSSLDSTMETAVHAAASHFENSLSTMESFPEVPNAATGTLTLLHTSIKNLDNKLEHQRDDISRLKTMLAKVLIGVPADTVVDSRTTAQSSGLAVDEQSQALSPLENQELKYHPYLSKPTLKRPLPCQASADGPL